MSDKNSSPLLERYQSLVNISHRLTSIFDLDFLLDQIVHAAVDLSNATAASILLYNSSTNELTFEATSNEPMLKGLCVPVDSSIAGWIIKHQEPIIIGNVNEDPRHYKPIEDIVNIETHSILGVPLITKGKIIGALEIINKKNGDFSLEDKEILTALGRHAALAIYNARLFQQSDLVSEFVHELRTPLSSITTAAQLLQYTQLPEVRRVKLANVIQTESIRLSDMAASFLDLARLESGRSHFNFVEIDIPNLLDDCIDLMLAKASEEGLEFLKEYPQKLPIILGDYDKLKQAIINLISNAIKYNRPGGSITLRTQVMDDKLNIEIEDTGIGIPGGFQKRLFEKFYRVPGSENIAPGTGLGLAVVKKIIGEHRGTINMISKQGIGTVFAINLPLNGYQTKP